MRNKKTVVMTKNEKRMIEVNGKKLLVSSLVVGVFFVGGLQGQTVHGEKDNMVDQSTRQVLDQEKVKVVEVAPSEGEAERTLMDTGEEAPDDMDDFTRQILEWEKEGIDPNHTEVIENVRNYISKNIPKEIYSSLHIDREENELGTIVLSFTEPIEATHEEALKELVVDPAELTIRLVDFSEKELMEKQMEIDLNEFSDQGLNIYFTSVNVFENKVEVGISPFNEENIQLIYERYGSEMLHVIEGHQARLMIEDDTADSIQEDTLLMVEEVTTTSDETGATLLKSDEEKEQNVFQRIFQSIRDWFSSLF
ncbi:hypothetical protein QA612_11015 [Evansella sp. AB-P1]|uniref:hypothetical protein n=1 Tax=Evansella sp. AB-P1 TaxID=3037653 RepID=UPI00241C36E6|nr:hypothetical protein [Evansella sp. AB-P1]MDG5788020.1 hypothetical protein [Evansella sp. AB-P1]